MDIEMILRRVIREERGITARRLPPRSGGGGNLVLSPGTSGLQEKSWPIRDVLSQDRHGAQSAAHCVEQQRSNARGDAGDVKVKLQSYISGCYGSLTSSTSSSPRRTNQFKGRRLVSPTFSRIRSAASAPRGRAVRLLDVEVTDAGGVSVRIERGAKFLPTWPPSANSRVSSSIARGESP
jgi:hypothetical protein